MSEMGTCEACNKDCHTGLIEAQAEIARLRTEIAAFQGLMTNVVPGDGSGEEVPATPESLRAYIKELQDEWDGAEKRLAAARAEEAEAIITWLKSGNVLTVSIDRSEMIAYLRARHPKEQANDPPRS